MAVKGQLAKNDAQSNQVPPTLRNFAREQDVTIGRFSDECETTNPGWKLRGQRIKLRHLPEGFKATRVVHKHDHAVVYVRPD